MLQFEKPRFDWWGGFDFLPVWNVAPRDLGPREKLDSVTAFEKTGESGQIRAKHRVANFAQARIFFQGEVHGDEATTLRAGVRSFFGLGHYQPDTGKNLSGGGGGGMVGGMNDDAPRPTTDEEIAQKIWRYEMIAGTRYRGRKPGHDYHQWADDRDDAIERLKHLRRIQENRALAKKREELAARPATDLERMMGITLADVLREYEEERDHQRRAS